MPRRILLLEHDADTLSILADILDEEGFAVTTAANTGAARDELVRGAFGLVLADLPFSGEADPWDRLSALRAQAAPAPVGVLTGARLTEEEAQQRGFAFLLAKPFSMEALLYAVGRHTAQGPLAPALAQRVRAYFHALEVRDWEGLGALCTADVTYCLPGDHPRFSRVIRGREEFRRFSRSTFANFPNARFSVESIAPLPGGAVARYTGRWDGPAGGTAPLEGAVLFHFRGEDIDRIGVRLNLDALSAMVA